MRIVSFALAATLLALPAIADSITPSVAPVAQRVRGKIATYDPTTRALGVTTTDKKTVTVTLAPDVRVIYDVKLTLAGIKAGDFIGSGNTEDGGRKAACAGSACLSGFHAWRQRRPICNRADTSANRLMTNATVAEVASVAPNRGSIKAELSRRHSRGRWLLFRARRHG